jgi:hypothetical protein
MKSFQIVETAASGKFASLSAPAQHPFRGMNQRRFL